MIIKACHSRQFFMIPIFPNAGELVWRLESASLKSRTTSQYIIRFDMALGARVLAFFRVV